ncbi:MAG TPA: DUF4468 domain-containing protein [Geobacteraceae bacterium]|nr:DUF4468 domain-containing protein [Geobacteraceae bacterium]
MKKAVLMFVLLLAGCATHRHMRQEDVVITTEIDVPKLSTVQSFDTSRTWLTRHLYSRKKIIEYADEATGVIVANGSITYPAMGKLDAIDKIQYTISFTMQEVIKEGEISLTFYDLLLTVPKSYLHSRLQPEAYLGGYTVPVEERSDFEAARKGVLELTAKLAEYLNQ